MKSASGCAPIISPPFLTCQKLSHTLAKKQYSHYHFAMAAEQTCIIGNPDVCPADHEFLFSNFKVLFLISWRLQCNTFSNPRLTRMRVILILICFLKLVRSIDFSINDTLNLCGVKCLLDVNCRCCFPEK